MTHKYKLTYFITPHPEGIDESDIPPEHGACDAIIIGSVINEDLGWRSQVVVSKDGTTGEELSPTELFKFWTLLAKELAESLPPGNRRDLCAAVFENVQNAVLGIPHTPASKDHN